MKRITLNIILLFTIISFWGCTKVFDEVKVQLNVDEFFHAKGTIPNPIPYSASGEKIDSICLIVDGKINNTQYKLDNEINIITEPNTRPIIKIAVYHHSGLITYSESVRIKITKYTKPSIDMMITISDGSNEQSKRLTIRLKNNTSGFDINSCKYVSLSINDTLFETQTESPFKFELDVITPAHPYFELEILDEDGIINTYEKDLDIT